MSSDVEEAYTPISAAQRERERAQAMWMLYEENCMLHRALAQYEPGGRWGLPSLLVTREVSLAREIMQEGR